MKYLKIAIYTTLVIISLAIIAVGAWAYQLNRSLENSLTQRRFLLPTSYFTAPLTVNLNDLYSKQQFLEILQQREYRSRSPDQKLFPGDYNLNETDDTAIVSFSPKKTEDPLFKQRPELQIQTVVFSADHIQGIQNIKGSSEIAYLEPQMFAQYLGNEPIMQRRVTLGEVPPACLNSVLAIEDDKFLEHQGISPSGIARAFFSNLTGGRFKQGGSTITQQMVKNYFLTSEKTFKRKATEILMSLLLELHTSKDQILETYLNIIYLGQNGPFQIRGFGAASEYYFQKPIEQLELQDCSLLAAILNSPGLFDPFKKPTNAFTRRQKVLDRMRDLKLISIEEHAKASSSTLPTKSAVAIEETAPYYIELANKEVAEDYGDELEGLQIYTGLTLQDQEFAQQAALNHLRDLEEKNKKIAALKEQKKQLEVVILSVDHRSGYVTAAIGGRGFRKSQFNRALNSRRQVGSIMKPLVFLTALNSTRDLDSNSDQDPAEFNALTPLKDEAYTFKYEGQTWTPQNYGKKYFGDVPMAYALIQSLNAATARLGAEVGLEKVIEVAQILGVQAQLKPVPSVSLGAFEVPPWEILKVYMTIAQQAQAQPMILRSFVHSDGFISREFPREPGQPLESEKLILSNESFFELIGIMKNAFTHGTAQSAKAYGFERPAAGKTGTTSDFKDSWFAGFTPYTTTITWVGYDDNTSSGLTGASGALPIWASFMAQRTKHQPNSDFNWPNTVEQRIETFQVENEIVNLPLIFKKEL